VVGPKGSPSYAAFQSALKEEQGGGGGGAIVASDGGITSASLKNGVNDSCTSNSASTSTSASTSGGATSSSSDSTITSGNMSNISGTAKAHVTFPAHERRFLGSTALVRKSCCPSGWEASLVDIFSKRLYMFFFSYNDGWNGLA